jgi:hypothetical protein
MLDHHHALFHYQRQPAHFADGVAQNLVAAHVGKLPGAEVDVGLKRGLAELEVDDDAFAQPDDVLIQQGVRPAHLGADLAAHAPELRPAGDVDEYALLLGYARDPTDLLGRAAAGHQGQQDGAREDVVAWTTHGRLPRGTAFGPRVESSFALVTWRDKDRNATK